MWEPKVWILDKKNLRLSQINYLIGQSPSIDDIGLTTPESTRTHEPILINDRVEDYYYYDDDYYYYDEEEYNTLFLDGK